MTSTTARATLPLLHRFLGIGMLVLSATFGVLRYFDVGPVLPEGRVSFVLACLLSAIGVVLATGTLTAIGYYLTGQPVAAAATGLLLIVFWMCGPNAFAKA